MGNAKSYFLPLLVFQKESPFLVICKDKCSSFTNKMNRMQNFLCASNMKSIIKKQRKHIKFWIRKHQQLQKPLFATAGYAVVYCPAVCKNERFILLF